MIKNIIVLFIFTFVNTFYAQKIEKSKNELNTIKEDTRPPLPTTPESEYPSQLTLPIDSINATLLKTMQNSCKLSLSLQINVFLDDVS